MVLNVREGKTVHTAETTPQSPRADVDFNLNHLDLLRLLSHTLTPRSNLLVRRNRHNLSLRRLPHNRAAAPRSVVQPQRNLKELHHQTTALESYQALKLGFELQISEAIRWQSRLCAPRSAEYCYRSICCTRSSQLEVFFSLCTT